MDRVGELIQNETIRLGTHDRIRGQCRVEGSTIRVADPSGAFIFCSTFISTTIECLKVSSGFRSTWFGCFFDSCTFKGKYYDRYFGLEHDQCSLPAGLRRCDFSRATLNLCSYFNCEKEDLHLPRWPHVTIFHPRRHAADFSGLVGDSLLERVGSLITGADEKKVALTLHLPTFLRESRPMILKHWEVQKLLARARSEPPPPRPEFSLDRMRELLQTRPYIFL